MVFILFHGINSSTIHVYALIQCRILKINFDGRNLWYQSKPYEYYGLFACGYGLDRRK